MTRSRIRLTLPVLAAVAALAVFPLLADAILVAPHALYLTDRQPSGEIYLVNQGDQPEDVTIEVVFGYPESDSAGEMRIRFDSTPAPVLMTGTVSIQSSAEDIGPPFRTGIPASPYTSSLSPFYPIIYGDTTGFQREKQEIMLFFYREQATGRSSVNTILD